MFVCYLMGLSNQWRYSIQENDRRHWKRLDWWLKFVLVRRLHFDSELNERIVLIDFFLWESKSYFWWLRSVSLNHLRVIIIVDDQTPYLKWLNTDFNLITKSEEQELRIHVKFIFFTGEVVESISIYPMIHPWLTAPLKKKTQ